MLKFIEDKKTEATHTLILMHGYGANCHDLHFLAECLELPWLNIICLQAPFKAPYPDGYAWFPIDIPDSLVEVDLSSIMPPHFEESAAQVCQWILERELNLSTLFLGGFSQGAMMSIETALQLPHPIAGTILFSGTLVAKERWEALARKKPGLPFFQSHGREDPLLSFFQAEKLQELLLSASWKGHLHAFEGGHTLPMPVVKLAQTFIEKTAF